jgi:hypothetical protein
MLSAVSPSILREFAAAHSAYDGLAAATRNGPQPHNGKQYALDETGHVLVVMPSQATALDEGVQRLFRKMTVFFGAVSQALSTEHRSVFDYDALSSVIEHSGFFAPLQSREMNQEVSAKDSALNLALIGELFTDLAQSPEALRIAKGILDTIGGLLRWAEVQGEATRSVAHLLFTCESLYGMPIASVRLYALNARENEELVKGDCRATRTSNVRVKYREQVYLFTDPVVADSVADSLTPSPMLDRLVEKLRAAIPAV